MMNRRLFVQGGSAAAIAARAGVGIAEPEKNAVPVRVGVIGPASRGKELVRFLLRVPGVKIVAAADVYEPRFAELNRVCGHNVEAHKDYRALVDRKDVDAVVVATPLNFHADHVLAALGAGKHVYGEKTMAFTLDECRKIVRVVEGGKPIFQVGHQYRYAPWIQAGVQKIRQGEIGDVTHVFGYWHRNSDWRRPVPDPKLERLINWRLYNQYSLGLLAELGSHHIDVTNWIFGEMPKAAIATGGVAEYHDGRENDDNVQAVLMYSKGRRFVFSSMTSNAMMGDQLWVYGTKGSVNLTLQDAMFYYEPKHAAPVESNATVMEKGITTGASYRAGGEMPYRGPGKKLDVPVKEDATLTACRSFIECIRTGKKPAADVHVGLGSALGVIVGNQSLAERRELAISY
jgi:predicted dehydrogenase